MMNSPTVTRFSDPDTQKLYDDFLARMRTKSARSLQIALNQSHAFKSWAVQALEDALYDKKVIRIRSKKEGRL